MAEKKSWSRLDNAAKAFPSTSEKSDTRVFRFSCELFEEIDPEILQFAVDKAIEEFPSWLCVMKRGLFWYYLEQSDLKPIVKQEYQRPCSPIYISGRRNLLFEVTYYKKRITLEVYHSLTDGTGSLQCLKTIVLYYLIEKHRDEFTELPFFDDKASASGRAEDDFAKYYTKEKKEKKPKAEIVKRAFNIRGIRCDDDAVIYIEGISSVKQVLEAAHKYNTTMTVYLTAAYIYAIGMEMSLQAKRYPVVIGVPVNLRNYFSSETARNFFGMMEVKYNFSERTGAFEDIISEVSNGFKAELTTERLAAGMNSYAALEHNMFVRIAPLFFKDFVIRAVRHSSDKKSTSVISNIGRIIMPEGCEKYINTFNMFTATISTQLCVCSFGDKLQMGFSTAFTTTAIAKNFFRILTDIGIDVEIRSNEYTDTAKGEDECFTAEDAK